MDEKINAAHQIIPAWFIKQMMSEPRTYGFMLVTGHVIAIELIDEVRVASDGEIWLDVKLAPANDVWGEHFDPSVFGAPGPNRQASIHVKCVSAAFELAPHPTPPMDHNH